MIIKLGKDSYEGYIKVHGRRFFFEAYLPNYPSMMEISLKLDWRLKLLLNNSLSDLVTKSESFEDFIMSLSSLVEKNLCDRADLEPSLQNPLKTHAFCKRIEEELQQLGDYISSVDIEKGLVEIQVVDAGYRVHEAVLKLGYMYPKEPIKIVSFDLPIEGNSSVQKPIDFKDVKSITAFLKKFIQCIDVFQEFWDAVSLLDSNCWILDPENPKYRDITRRIKMLDGLSIVVTFNAYFMKQRPEIRFLGCQTHVNQYRELLQANLENETWDADLDILCNLSNILEFIFPSKPEYEENMNMDLVQPGECAICLTIRLDDEMPTQICDNTVCMSHYHASCLFKYLRSVPKNKNFFGRIQGECPNCEQVITCPVPNFT